MNIQKVVTDDMTDTRTLQIKIEVRERQLASLSGDEREVEAAMLRIERDQLEETRAVQIQLANRFGITDAATVRSTDVERRG